MVVVVVVGCCQLLLSLPVLMLVLSLHVLLLLLLLFDVFLVTLPPSRGWPHTATLCLASLMLCASAGRRAAGGVCGMMAVMATQHTTA